MKNLVTYISLLLITSQAFAQSFRPGDWKRYRKEVYVSMGSAHFLGDLGGRNKVGTDFSPADLDFNQTRTSFGAGFRYRIEKWLNVSATFNYMILRGDDAETSEIYRNNRNLNFKSNVFELCPRIEAGYTSGRSAARYSIKRSLSAKVHRKTWSVYGYTGVGVFYYNPKGKMPDGKYTKLRPLHTEGQGLDGGPKQYGKFSINIPVGVYYRLTWDRRWSLGIDLCWRKTFTDYIDDVGTYYYDPAALTAAYGPLSSQMADPSKGNVAGATKPDGAGRPAQRGDLQKDSYFTIQITGGYTIKNNKRKKARLRSKF